MINTIPNVNAGCAFKPLPGCNDHVRLTSLLVNLAGLFLLWSMPFLSPLMTKFLLKAKKDIHFCIEEHGREALKFQLETAIYIAVTHFIFLLLLGLLNSTLGGLLGTTLLIILFDLFLFPVFAVLQLVAATDVAIQTLKGKRIQYPKIR
jgi:uncharacterized Tic20 family protein